MTPKNQVAEQRQEGQGPPNMQLSAAGPRPMRLVFIMTLGQKSGWGATCLPGKGSGLSLTKWYFRGSHYPASPPLLSFQTLLHTYLGKPSLPEYPTPTPHSHPILVT